MGGAFVINRRMFVGGLGGLAAFPGAAGATIGPFPRAAYAAESGKYGTWPRVFGLLTTTTPMVHAAAIELLRRRAGYPRPLLYTSTDRRKVVFARAVIDHFARTPDLHFTAVVLEDAGVEPEEIRRCMLGTARNQTATGSNLAQLASFLTGCVHGSATGIAHPVKAGLIAHLQDRVALLAAAPQAGRFTVLAFGKNNTG
ncbi:hypothetical protein BH10PSE9_BH10PSE9_17300 [soil metagenome]